MSTIVPANGLLRRADGAFVVAVWAVATLANLGKAAHVDDGADLAIAERILVDPLHPMSGTLFWGTHPEPIHAANQPHLLFYVLAAALALSGGSLVAAQAALSAIVLPGVAAFHALARRLLPAGPSARLATALVFLGPAFVPGQNLMCDAPLVSLACLALWLVVTSGGADARRLALAGLVVGVACLVKYTALALVPVFAIDAWRAREPRRAWPIAIVLVVLAAYGAFNVYDYGGVHILERQPGGVGDFGPLARIGIVLARAALFVLTLGAVALAPWALPTGRRTWAMLAAALAVLVAATRGVAAVGPPEMRDEPWAVSVLRAAFFLAGLVAIARVSRSIDLGDRDDVLLASAAASLALFIVVLSPFVAVRHVLLALPPVTLLVLRRAVVDARRAIVLGVVSSVLGLGLAASDRAQADVYREAAARYRERSATRGQTWFVGHWGWQWYAQRSGLRAYDPGVSVLRPGDVIIRPAFVDAQPFDPADAACLAAPEAVVFPAGATAVLRTITSRQGYYAVWQGLPYGPSDEPLEVFEEYRVTCFASGASAVQPASR